MNFIDLGGHSGCTILLFEDENGKNKVRKISKDKNYNKRLEEQCRKQKEFKSDVIKAPKVFFEGYNGDGLFYFDMEYIHGITLAEYLKTIEIGKIRGLVEAIVCGISNGQKGNGQVDTKIFENKISDLKQTLSQKDNAVINEAIAMLERHSWSCFESSACHGDLTLENIIVKDNQLYLIDFLDSFYDSWLIDIGTLLQDVQVLWSYRKDENVSMNTIIRLMVFRDLLTQCVNDMGGYMKEAYYALLLKLIRIYPYTKDEATYEFLNVKTQMVIELLKKEER